MEQSIWLAVMGNGLYRLPKTANPWPSRTKFIRQHKADSPFFHLTYPLTMPLGGLFSIVDELLWDERPSNKLVVRVLTDAKERERRAERTEAYVRKRLDEEIQAREKAEAQVKKLKAQIQECQRELSRMKTRPEVERRESQSSWDDSATIVPHDKS